MHDLSWKYYILKHIETLLKHIHYINRLCILINYSDINQFSFMQKIDRFSRRIKNFSQIYQGWFHISSSWYVVKIMEHFVYLVSIRSGENYQNDKRGTTSWSSSMTGAPGMSAPATLAVAAAVVAAAAADGPSETTIGWGHPSISRRWREATFICDGNSPRKRIRSYAPSKSGLK